MVGVSTPPRSLLNDRSLHTIHRLANGSPWQTARADRLIKVLNSCLSDFTYRDCRLLSWPMSAARLPLMPMVESFLKESACMEVKYAHQCCRMSVQWSFLSELCGHLHGDHFVVAACHSFPRRVSAGIVGLSPGRRRVLPLIHQRPEHRTCNKTPRFI
jgi:hypothetical protein